MRGGCLPPPAPHPSPVREQEERIQRGAVAGPGSHSELVGPPERAQPGAPGPWQGRGVESARRGAVAYLLRAWPEVWSLRGPLGPHPRGGHGPCVTKSAEFPREAKIRT